MKKIILIQICLSFTSWIFSQNLQNPSSLGNTNATDNLRCDFGPRNVLGDPNATKFHKGLDYSVGGNYGKAYAVEGGTITLPTKDVSESPPLSRGYAERLSCSAAGSSLRRTYLNRL